MAVTDDEILKFRERFQQKQAERMRTMAELPETAADDPETQGLAEKLNVAPDVIASDPQAFANKAKTSQYDWEKIAKDNPALTELLQDPNHAKSALRSMGALESVESNLAGYPYAKTLEIANREARIADRGPIDYLGNVADDVKKNWEIGQLNSELADIGSRDMFGEATEDDRLRATELETRLAELAALEFDLGYVGEVPGAMAESLPLMIDIMLGSTEYAAAGAGAGVVTGGAIGTVVPGAGTVGGALTGAGIGARAGWTTGTVMESAKLEAGLMFNDFKKMTDENGDLIDQDVARGGAMIAGLMAGGLEAVSLDVLLKQIPGADRVLTGMGKEQLRYAMKQPRVRDALANFGKRIATGMTVEGITEGAQEAINVLAEWSIAAVAEGDFETTTGEEALSRIGHATYRGSQGGVGFSTMTGTAGIVNDVRKMRQANNRKAALTAISESSKEARDKITPKQYRSFVENVVETHGAVDQVYVSKDQLQTFFQDSGIDETVVQDRMPDVFDQLKGDEDLVSIKMEDFVEYMSHLDTFDSLADHIKFDPMDMTPAEAIQYKAELQTILKEYETVSNIQEKAAETDRPVMSAMYDYLMSTGMPSDQAMPQAAVWEARYRTRADALGVDAFELFKSENVTVTRETAGNVPKMDRIDALLNMLREGKGPTEKEIFGSSITEYIIGKGGIKDEGGEAAARDWDRAQPEFGGRRIAREEGMPVDQALESAIEAGFFPGKDLGELTADDLYTMIEQDLSGERVYAPGTEDVQALALRDELANLEGMLEAAGIDNLEGIENQTVQDMLYTYEQAAGGKNAITGDLNKVNPAAREAAIESLDAMDADDRLRMTANLDMLKGTPWAAAAVKGLVYRTMLNRALRGEDIRNLEVNEVWGKQDMGKTEIIRTIKSGDQRLIKKMIGNYDFIGNNRKAEQDISTSFSNCDPSKACAAFCYAAKGNARPNEIAKSEFTEWALENYTDLVAEEIAGSYGRSMPAQDGLALRLNDKGDLSKAQVKLVKKLNDRGIRMQIFSKRPELLRKLSDFNLRMLSIDDTNFQMALDNPDLNIAFTITEATTEKMLEAVNDRVRVYLPVTMTGKHMTRQQVKELYPNLFGEMTTKLCPVDAGKLKTAPGTNYVNVTQGKEKGLWTCTSCDLTGCAGCFHGENTTANVRKVQFTSNISTEKRDTLTDKSIQEHKDAAQTLFDAGLIDNEQFNTILTAIDQGSSTVWSDADARTEGAGDKEFTDGLSAQEQNRAGDPETAGQVVTSGEVDLDVNGRQIRFTMPKRAQRTDTMVLIDTDKVEREWRKSEGFYVGEQGKNGIGKRYQNLKKSFAETDTMNTPELGFMDNGFPMFTDGRHRFAVMRDMGMNVIPVALDPASLQIAIKHGYVQTETYNQDIIQGQEGSATTQVATTTGSYTKAAKKVLELKPDAEYVLDYGAGLGLGTDAIRKEIPAAESYEPFPERWKGERPVTYSNSNEIPATYDAVISLNVLNVLEPELRDQVATDIISKLAPGGVAVIGTRKWKGDVNGAKNFDPAEEEHAIWVKRKQGGKEVRVYQRGFDGNELVEYMERLAGPGFTVKKGSGIAASTVYITREETETFYQGNGKADLSGDGFQTWFKDSKVVDEDGKPMVVYHGTRTAGFNTFSKAMAGTATGHRHKGFYFSGSRYNASSYSGDGADAQILDSDVEIRQPGIYQVYLSLQNPMIVDFEGRNWDGSDIDGDPIKPIYEYEAEAARKGHDGLIVKNLSDEGPYGDWEGRIYDTYIAFEPAQIKSADQNKGTYNGTNPNILYQTDVADMNFRAWFEGSKIVNEDGTPMMLYRGEHGATETDKLNTKLSLPTFTPNKYIAQDYAMDAEQGRVGMYYANVQNPFDINIGENGDFWEDVVSVGQLKKLLPNLTDKEKELLNAAIGKGWNWRGTENTPMENDALINPDYKETRVYWNPDFDTMDDEAYSDTFELVDRPEFIEILKGRGYDGVRYVGSFSAADKADVIPGDVLDTLEVDGELEVRVFDPAQIRSGLGGIDVTFQQGPRGYITTNANRDFMQITLTGNANLSTFIHESGHAFLFQLLKDAEKENAPQQMKDDAAIVRSWWSENAESIAKEAGVTVDDVNAWLADDFNGKPSDAQAINTAVNEQFARGFEAYVREGKAPSAELRPAFARFKAWMTWIYRTLKRLNVNLSDDIRGVMDRMLASDQEIRAAADQISFEMIFTDQDVKDGLLTQEEFDKFNAEHMKALDAAKQEVEQTLLRTLRRERDQEYRKRYNKYFEQYLAEVFQRQDIRARYLLINGKLPGEDETPLELQNVHLSKDGIEDLLPGQANKFTGLYRVEGGIHPDFLAPKLGYDSGMALLNDMLAKPKWNDEAKKLTDARMAEEFPDPMKDGTVSEEAIQEIHDTNGVGQFLHMELKALSKKAGRPAPSMQVLREAAATRISEMEIMSINPNKYMMAEQSAARKADKAKADGDFALATDMKRRQLLNHAMYREAMKAREKVDKNLSRLKSFEQKSYQARLMKAGQEYRDAVNALLEMIDLRKVSNMEARRRQLLMTARDAVNSNEDLEADLEDIPAKSWKSYTPDELQALRDEIEYIYKQARDLYNIIIDGEKMDFDVLRGDLIGSIHENATVKPEQDRLAISKAKTLGEWLEWGAAIHAKPEFMFRQLDGNKAGIWWKVFMPTLQHAEDRRATMLETYGNRMREILKPLRRTFQEKIEVPGKDIRITKETVFSMALNYGNEDNRRKLYEGQEKDGWSQRMVDDIVMKNMTKEDWDAVQAVWDMIEEFWEPIKELEERRKGVAPAKVIPEKVETPHGVYAGGYYPVVTDIGSELRANQLEDAKSLKELADNSSVRAATRKGHTKERVKSHGMRLRLDVGVIADHIEQVVQDIAFDEPTRELYKILDDRELQLEMAKVLGNEKVQMLKTWMVDVARGTYGSEPGWQRRYAKILNWIRQNTTIFNMGYKLTTAIVQPLGVTQTMQQLGVAPVLSQSLSFWSRPLKWRSVSREVFEKSTFMRNRAKNFDRDLRDALNKMQKGHPWFDWHAKLKEEAFRHIGILDLAVTVPTWKTAYQHAIGNLEMNEQGAIDFADGVVRQTQSAGSIINLAQVQRGGAGMRLMTMFYSYFSSFYNMMAEQKRESVDQWNADQKAKAIAGATSAVILLNILPAILAELAVGRGPEEDEDWFLWFIKKNGGQLAGGLVGVRDLASATMTDFDYAPSPIVGAVDTITRTVGTAAGGEVPRVKDLVNSAGYLTGSPFAGREAWILYNNAFKLYEGEDLTAFEALMVQENRD